jgi:HAD superfamily 5'-nucleotidase-like hydrolase
LVHSRGGWAPPPPPPPTHTHGVNAPCAVGRFIKPLLDSFSLAEACLIADVIQLLRDRDISFDPSAVAADVAEAVSHAHMSGKVHEAVMKDLPLYIKPKPQLKSMLESFRRDGKELFLASNSDFEFVSAGMTYLVGNDWRSLFDEIIVSARKPSFYGSNRPFR